MKVDTTSEKIFNEFYEVIKDDPKYSRYGKDKIKEAVFYPYKHIKDLLLKGNLFDFRLKYIGKFSLHPHYISKFIKKHLSAKSRDSNYSREYDTEKYLNIMENLLFKNKRKNFGTHPRNTVVPFEFIGSEILDEVLSIKVSCSCLKVEATEKGFKGTIKTLSTIDFPLVARMQSKYFAVTFIDGRKEIFNVVVKVIK